MKRYYVLFSFLIVSSFSFGQRTNDIIYVLPDSVEILLDGYINSFERENVESSFYIILKNVEEFTELTILNYSSAQKENIPQYVVISDRKAIIGNRLIPVILDYDLRFGTTTPYEKLGKIGKREGYYRRQQIISHSPSLLFDNQGRLVKCEFLLQKK